MRIAGLVILMLGVALSALFGARNPEAIDARTEAGGVVLMHSIKEGSSWQKICDEIEALSDDEAACKAARPGMPAAMESAESLDEKVVLVRNWVRALRAAATVPSANDAYDAWLKTVPAAKLAELEQASDDDAEGAEDAPEDGAEEGAGDASPESPAVQARDDAWTAFCDGLDPKLEHCADVMPTVQLKLDPEAEVATTRERLEAWGDHQRAFGAMKEPFTTWVAAYGALNEAKLESSTLEVPSTGARLGQWFQLGGLPYLAGIALIVIGGIMARKAERAAAEAEPTDEAGKRRGPIDLGEVVDLLRDRTRELAEEIGDATRLDDETTESIKDALDELVLVQIEPVVQTRGRIQMKYGMAGFAQFFGPFSAGERQINRAWSALVDEHPPEAKASLEKATVQFGEARHELDALSGNG